MSNDWKEEFLKLYLSGDQNDFLLALDLKRNNLPKKLYRYRSISKTSSYIHVMNEIKRGEIYLSQPTEFNDTFDSYSVLSSKSYLDYWKDPYPLREVMKNHLSEDELTAIFDREDWREEYSKTITEKIAAENNIETNGIAEILNDAIMKQLIDLNDAFNQMAQTSRIACFTESHRNLPMWTHYANKQQGICLEYDTIKLLDPFHISRMLPVLYVEKVSDVVRDSFQSKFEKPPFGLLDSISIQKHHDWSYEKEWRLVYPVGAFYFSPSDVPPDYDQQGKLIHFIRPSKIILGYKINADIENSIRDAATASNIEIEKLKLTPYGLSIE